MTRDIEMQSARLREAREPDRSHQYCSQKPAMASLLAILTDAESIAKQHSSNKLSWHLRDLRERIVRDQFRIAIVGQFKRGKTSLLNTLLGEADLLPVGTLPFTSILTIVQQGRYNAAEVVFQSGRRLPISVNELKDYVTEAGNPGNSKMVEQVEVFCPADILNDGVGLVNSPGFGSLSDQNTQTAYDYLPRIDAAIFVTSPDPPLTAAEMEFLKKLASTTKKVFVVMNKVDVLDESALAEVLRFTQNAMTRVLCDRVPRVYPVSALLSKVPPDAFVGSAGIHALQSDLREFLNSARWDTFITSVSGCLSGVISALRTELESRVAAASATAKDMENRRSGFARELQAPYEEHAHNERLFVDTVNRLGDLAENELLRFTESKRFDLDSPLRVFLCANDRLPKQQLARAVDDFATLRIDSLFNSGARELEASLVHAVSAAAERFVQAANDVIADLRSRLVQQFGIEIQSESIKQSFVGWASPEQRALEVSPRKPPSAVSLLPRPLLRRWVLRRATRAVRLRLQSTGQSIAKDLSARMRSAIETFTDAVRRDLHHNLETLLTPVLAVQEQHESAAVIHKQNIARLLEDIQELDQLAGALRAFTLSQPVLEA